MRRIQENSYDSRNFQGQKLRGKSFKQQDLSGANFQGADLQRANFSKANLEGVDFSQTIIQGANFSMASLRDAKFINAKAGLEKYWSIISILLLIGLSYLCGAFSTLIGTLLFGRVGYIQSLSLVGGIVAITIEVTFLIISRQRGISMALSIASVEISGFGFIAGVIGTYSSRDFAVISIATATATILAVAVTSVILFAYTSILSIVRLKWTFVAPISALIGVMSISRFATGEIGSSLRERGFWAISVTSMLAIIITLICIQISYHTLNGDPRNAIMKSFAVAVTASLGTRFREANLTNANFSGAIIRNTDFRIDVPKDKERSTKHDYTQWYQTTGLDYARWGHSVLRDSRVQNLLITRIGRNKFYDDADLRGTDVSGFDFYQATLTGANLIGATLQGACLERANLKLVKALNTNFTRSEMTGAIIEAWSIDHLTRLEEVDCKFVYLEESNSTGELKRSPASGEFEPGNFTKVFQVTQNTLDLILQEGVVPSALEEALKAIKFHHADIRLKSIDQRSDGLFVFTVIVPEGVNREAIDQTFRQVYHETVSAIEAQYVKKLAETYREKSLAEKRAILAESKLRELTQFVKNMNEFLGSAPDRLKPKYKSVFLDFGIDDPESEGLTVRGLLISEDNSFRPFKAHGFLPPSPDLFRCYARWKEVYDCYYNPERAARNIAQSELMVLAKGVEQELNKWLRVDSFHDIYTMLLKKLDTRDEVHFFIQTTESNRLKLNSLPWHLWSIFKDYRKASFTIGMSQTSNPSGKNVSNSKRVLVVSGESSDIDIESDRQKFQGILSPFNVELEFLYEPSRRIFTQYLWDPNGWDILYFSGHSESDNAKTQGVIYLNQTEAISFNELPETLSTAIDRGLKLAIFNCCDGLGLAYTLEKYYIPNVIVMQQEVHDEISHAFLESLLGELIQGKSIYTAFRSAREQLEALEDIYPCATWLPTLLTNSAEPPFYWIDTPDPSIQVS